MALTVAQVQLKAQLHLPDGQRLYDNVLQNAVHRLPMVRSGSGVGQRVAICGAGPSLRDTAALIPQDVDQVWACNSALPYLVAQQQRVTHGFAIDQGDAMLEPHEWGVIQPVSYLVASSVSPKLMQHLRRHECHITAFHSYIGLPNPDTWTPPANRPDVSYEMWLYTTLYAESIQVGYGLNAVPRAVCLALAMGFSDILVYGADCACVPNSPEMPTLGTPEYAAWLAQLVMYPDGRTASQYGVDAAFAEATIDGVRWHTRPDMVISATMLVDLAKEHSRIRFVGAGLPTVLISKDADFMADMPRLVGDQVHGFGAHGHSRLQVQVT